MKCTHGFQLTTVFTQSFYLSASEPPDRFSGKFMDIVMGNVRVVVFVKLMYVLHYSNRVGLSVIVHFKTWRKTKPGCSECC